MGKSRSDLMAFTNSQPVMLQKMYQSCMSWSERNNTGK